MTKFFSLTLVFLLAVLYSSEIPAENWDEVKRKIPLASITSERAREKACEEIEVLKNDRQSVFIYSCVQKVTDINLLPHAILKTAKLLKKLEQKERRIDVFLETIVDLDVKNEAKIAIDKAPIEDRLVTARAWKYLAFIEDELIRGRAAKAVEEKRLQKKAEVAWIFMNLSCCIADYIVLNSAISAVISASEKDALKTMDVWFCLAAITDTEDRKKAIKAVNKAELVEIKLRVARNWLKKQPP